MKQIYLTEQQQEIFNKFKLNIDDETPSLSCLNAQDDLGDALIICIYNLLKM
jgi:hypothetical protein